MFYKFTVNLQSFTHARPQNLIKSIHIKDLDTSIIYPFPFYTNNGLSKVF